MGQSWTNRVRRMGILCAINLSLYLNCIAGVDQGEKKVTLNVVEESCVRVFKQIEKQTKMSFFYSTSDIKLPGKVSIKVVDAALDEVMGRILEGTNLEWIYTDNVITIRKKKGLAGGGNGTGTVVDSNINMITVTGKVTQADGTGIPGATVRVKRTGDGATSDAEGNFSLPNVRKNDKLTISSIGYETREIPVNGTSILLKLNIAVNELDVTVVKGYYNTTKRLNTGNVSKITADNISTQPIQNPLMALEGRVPGMEITQASGFPGSGVVVKIRGRNSINNGNDPLYIVDGVPFSSQLLPNFSGVLGGSGNTSPTPAGNGNPLSYINPLDIESIEILKDADATAIYGSRGANGVVLITTKKGRSGKISVQVNLLTGWGRVAKKMKLLNTRQYLDMRYEAFKNDGVHLTPTSENSWDLTLWDTTRQTDWQHEFLGGTAKYQNAQFAVTGGNDLTQYRLSATYHKETTVMPGDFNDQKAAAQININSGSSNGKLKISFSANYTVDNNRLPGVDLTQYAIQMAPNAPPVYHEDGSLNWAHDANGNATWENPLSYIYTKVKNRTTNLISNSVISYQLARGLQLKSSFGYNLIQTNEVMSKPSIATDPNQWNLQGPYLRNSQFSVNDAQSWLIEPQVTYNGTLWKGKLEVLLGTTIQQNRNDGKMFSAYGYSSDQLIENFSAAPYLTAYPLNYSYYKYNALFGRINYNGLDKYIINLTARRDGSSRFGPESQFHNFWALGTAWIFSNESFCANNLPFVSFGKLRASYGTTGSDQVGEYSYVDLYNPLPSTSPYQGGSAILPDRLFNPNLAWEETNKLEVGLEIGLLKDRLLLSSSYYRNRSSNQLVDYSLPSIVGFMSVKRNLEATLQNKGWEFQVTTINVQTNKFKWTSDINLTFNRNKLLSVEKGMNDFYQKLIGLPITGILKYNFTGVDPETGFYQVADKKGTPTASPIFPDDATALVDLSPQYYGGLQNTFQFKGFQLDLLIQFVRQKGIDYLFNYIPGNIFGGNQPITVLDRWQKPGDKTSIQKFSQDFSTVQPFLNASILGNIAFRDASYIRCKNISLSWQLPEQWRNSLNINQTRLFIQAQNVFTFTNYEGLDPETRSSVTLPPLRIITIGLQATL